jgi:RNA polymerase sigma-70 factor (ECF subfamily)
MANRRRAVGSEPIPLFEIVEARADLERRIEEILNRELLDLAILKVRSRVAPATWDAFRLSTFEEYTGAQVSRLLNMPIASVFVAKHRVQKLLKQEIQKLEGAAEE